MRFFLFTTFLALLCNFTFGQQAVRQVVGSLGRTATASSPAGATLSMTMTVGEAVIGSYSGPSFFTSKGFQHPIISLSNLRTAGNPDFSFFSSELYPNPASSKAMLRYQASEAQVQLIDMSGKQLWQQELTEDAGIVNLPVYRLPEGVYLVILRSEHYSRNHKLVISR